ncbi:SWIM zinc finger family protein [Cellulomonas sp. NPDC089187]|uniref:SWIM zinc finger family protein n=1 Tax=Cellulomonas sp. NPDC089187 TaxID=3154970 RepID=UPI00341D1A06
MRSFAESSTLTVDGLDLALAPGLTPDGIVARPSFFHGFATRPQVVARGLVTLADITATRYFQYTPTAQRDPVLTAQGDRLRAECFSACNGVYARLDLLGTGFDGGDIARGTTNVDIGATMRSALTEVARDQLLHLDVGSDGLAVSSPEHTAVERPVQMPDRWVRALGNAAELHHGLPEAFTLTGMAARQFVAALPAATGTGRDGWLAPTRTGVRLTPRRTPGAVHIAGLHRLSAVKRMLSQLRDVRVYGTDEPGPVLVEFGLPEARLTLGLTEESWRGHSGEGALLTALAGAEVLADADLISALLAFEPVIEVPRLAREAALDEDAVHQALAVLAVSGRVGWDAHDRAWFHRELPDEPDRVEKDNPRLVTARRLAEAGKVHSTADGVWLVGSSRGAVEHRVQLEPDSRCTCPWWLRHGNGRGPCAHVLAVRMSQDG